MKDTKHETNQNASHTPGPWRTREHGDANHTFLLDGKGDWLAVIQQNGGMLASKQEANARLMAASPKLLAALQFTREWFTENDLAEEYYSICDHLDEAITEATGRAA